jgi:hypothetical protein
LSIFTVLGRQFDVRVTVMFVLSVFVRLACILRVLAVLRLKSLDFGVTKSTIFELFLLFHSDFFSLQSLVLLECELPSLLLVLVLFVLSQIQRLVVLTGKLLLSSQLVSDCLIDPGPTTCSLDVRRVQAPHVGLLEGDPVLVGILLWTRQHSLLLDLGMVEAPLIVFAAGVGEVILAGGYF